MPDPDLRPRFDVILLCAVVIASEFIIIMALLSQLYPEVHALLEQIWHLSMLAYVVSLVWRWEQRSREKRRQRKTGVPPPRG